MPSLRLSDQRRAAREFFNQEIRGLENATKAVTRTTARALKRETLQELRTFRRGPQGTGGFQKAAKIYDVLPRGSLGPASYVRLGVPFMGVFQETTTIRGRPNLAILLRTGEALGFRRLSKGNRYDQALAKMRRMGTVRIFPTRAGTITGVIKDGRLVPIYLFKPEVQTRKKLSFYEMAEDFAAQMPSEIMTLLDSI
jgi:hypothetical protein